jgi:hypothetical protein
MAFIHPTHSTGNYPYSISSTRDCRLQPWFLDLLWSTEAVSYRKSHIQHFRATTLRDRVTKGFRFYGLLIYALVWTPYIQ